MWLPVQGVLASALGGSRAEIVGTLSRSKLWLTASGGSETKKLVPIPTVDSTRMDPPTASAHSAAIASPRPDPRTPEVSIEVGMCPHEPAEDRRQTAFRDAQAVIVNRRYMRSPHPLRGQCRRARSAAASRDRCSLIAFETRFMRISSSRAVSMTITGEASPM